MARDPSEVAQPRDLATALRESIASDHETRRLDATCETDLLDLARWGRALGLEHGVHQALGVEPSKRLTDAQLAAYLRSDISPHPARFDELAEAVQSFEATQLGKEAARLEGCGTPWGRVVRLFWRDRKGREVMRTRGLHSCKHRWCPRCGKPRQTRLAADMERVIELMKEWGFMEAHLRFLTLTVPNGTRVPELRDAAHKAWAKLQRTRWWPKHVFGWFRGTEVLTGQDGAWNLHLHIVVVLWDQRISYQQVWKAWEAVNGARYEVDIQTLRDIRRGANARGTTRAVHYITKYIAKREALAKLRLGPGGLAHLLSATKRMRCFAMGGGCSLLRRLADILLPSWAIQAERVLADAELRDGRPPFRMEEVDPETGEVFDGPSPKPYLDEAERARWVALAAPLADDLGTVGVRCGPRGRFRRLGRLPLPGKPLTLHEHRAGLRQRGIRALVGEGDWRVTEWVEQVKAYQTDPSGRRVPTGGTRALRFRVLLPHPRYAWKFIADQVWSAMQDDPSAWAQLRRKSFRAHAHARIGPIERLDHLRALRARLETWLTSRAV